MRRKNAGYHLRALFNFDLEELIQEVDVAGCKNVKQIYEHSNIKVAAKYQPRALCLYSTFMRQNHKPISFKYTDN